MNTCPCQHVPMDNETCFRFSKSNGRDRYGNLRTTLRPHPDNPLSWYTIKNKFQYSQYNHEGTSRRGDLAAGTLFENDLFSWRENELFGAIIGLAHKNNCAKFENLTQLHRYACTNLLRQAILLRGSRFWPSRLNQVLDLGPKS